MTASYLTITKEEMRRCNLFWSQFKYELETTEKNGKCYYTLNGPQDALHLEPFLTDAQRLTIYQISKSKGISVDSILAKLSFEFSSFEFDHEIYRMPDNLCGTWPHCGLYGVMLPDGSIHT